jgi:chlorite dismutase
MTTPINLTQLRLDAECWNKWEPPTYSEEHAAAVLALIDTAEAAMSAYPFLATDTWHRMPDVQREHVRDRLRETLNHYTTP